MSVKRPAIRLGWSVVGVQKWGFDVVLLDPLDPEQDQLMLVPESPKAIGWASPEEARLSAAAALRELADRIEKGEP